MYSLFVSKVPRYYRDLIPGYQRSWGSDCPDGKISVNDAALARASPSFAPTLELQSRGPYR
jgi:hypothetical protein